MITNKPKQLEHIRSQIETAVATVLRAYPKAQHVLIVPIILECSAEPRIPYDVWLVSQYRDYGNG